jgi:hypothetical protein
VSSQLGDAEVEDLDEVGVLLAGDAKAVLRLHVAVHDLGGVGGREGATDLQEDVLRAGPRAAGRARNVRSRLSPVSSSMAM